jgi:hypothetical protein
MCPLPGGWFCGYDGGVVDKVDKKEEEGVEVVEAVVEGKVEFKGGGGG